MFVITATPSYANTVDLTFTASSSFKSLEDSPISEIPSIASLIPADEPV